MRIKSSILVGIIFLPFILYLNSCFCGFVFDDISAVKRNKDALGETSISNLLWNDYWGTSMSDESSHKSYRPFTVLTYRFNHLLFGAEPWSYHFVNVLLNCLVCYLLFQLYSSITKLCFNQNLRELGKGKWRPYNTNGAHKKLDFSKDEFFISIVATLLFSVHPIHTESITGVVGRAELLSTIFFILAILCYIKLNAKFIMLALVLSIFAVASKEQGVTVIAVCIFIDVIIIHQLTLDDFCLLLVSFFYSPKRIKFKPLLFRIFLCVCFVATNLGWRYHVMQGKLPHFTNFDNPASSAETPSRQLTFNYLLPVNFWLLLFPNDLLCDWTMGTIPLIKTFDDIRNVATLIFWIIYIAIGFNVFFRDPVSKMTSLSVAIASFSFLPASNLFFSVGFVVAERVLFLPSIGFCLLISVGFWIVKKKYKHGYVINATVLVILFSHSLKTLHRNTEWKSELDLFQSGLKITKNNAKIWNNVGHVYESEEKWEKALGYFIEAAKVQPDDLGAHQNVARMYQYLGDKVAAEANYRKAKELLPKPVPGRPFTARVAPSSLKIFIKLAELIKSDRPEEADQLYQEAIRMRPMFLDALLSRGEILLTLNRPKEALHSYEKALSIPTANKSDIYYNIGIVHSFMGNKTGAIEAYTYAISNNPHNVKALFNSAVIFEETREPSLLIRAKSRVERVLALEPDNVLAMTLLGTIYMDLGENNEAINWWNKVLSINETQRTCLFNMALLYSRIDGKAVDCIQVVEKLLRHYPNHAKGLQLYGDVMLNKIKDIKEAKKAYSRLIELNPSHLEAHHNLCVAQVEEGDLKGAEICLLRVYNMAPHLDYVQDNLAKVRRQINFIEIGEREKKEREQTHFKKTLAVSLEKEDTPEEKKLPIDQLEETIYVAQPIKKKHVTAAQEAKQIRENLKNSQTEDIEENLKKTANAVQKLQDLQKKVEQKKAEKCPSNKLTEELKDNALKVLDELESLIKSEN